jgi:hypothetical protein
LVSGWIEGPQIIEAKPGLGVAGDGRAPLAAKKIELAIACGPGAEAAPCAWSIVRRSHALDTIIFWLV